MTIFATAQLIAVAFSALLAWDFGRMWINEQSARRVADERLKHQDDRIDLLDQSLTSLAKERKAMAEDWMKKFVQLERDWQKLKEHADSQYAGARAQVEANQPRGYHRG
jgi:hypothetical protein